MDVSDLINPRITNKDVLHIRATRGLEAALSATSVIGVCGSQGLDIKWVVILNFQDNTHSSFGFGALASAKCVSIESQPADLAVSKQVFDYVERTFGFLNDST